MYTLSVFPGFVADSRLPARPRLIALDAVFAVRASSQLIRLLQFDPQCAPPDEACLESVGAAQLKDDA